METDHQKMETEGDAKILGNDEGTKLDLKRHQIGSGEGESESVPGDLKTDEDSENVGEKRPKIENSSRKNQLEVKTDLKTTDNSENVDEKRPKMENKSNKNQLEVKSDPKTVDDSENVDEKRPKIEDNSNKIQREVKRGQLADSESTRCAFYVYRKKRSCRMMVKPGKKFCGEHANQEEGGEPVAGNF